MEAVMLMFDTLENIGVLLDFCLQLVITVRHLHYIRIYIQLLAQLYELCLLL